MVLETKKILPLFALLLSLIFIQPSYASGKKDKQADVETSISEQLGDNLKLKSWELSDVEKTVKGPVALEKSKIHVTADTKEALYQVAGRKEDGKTILNLAMEAGEQLELQGIMIKTILPEGLGESQTRVIIAPGQAHMVPLSNFPEDSYVIAEKITTAENKAETEKVAEPEEEGIQPPVKVQEPDKTALNKMEPVKQQDSIKKKEVAKPAGNILEPWKTSGEITDYFHIKNRLFKIDTLEEVNSSWVDPRMNSPMVINNMPSHFMPFERIYELASPPAGAYLARNVKTLVAKERNSIHPFDKTDNIWMSSDFKEYVTLKNGDLWKGEVDWKNNSFSKEKNITNIGILNNLGPISWYENDFYFFNKNGSDKPILRINIQNGNIEEMAETAALHKASIGSPNGRFIFFSDGRKVFTTPDGESFVYVYDCKTKESFKMDATIDERGYIGTMKIAPRGYRMSPEWWLSNSTFISKHGVYDLEKRERKLFIEAKGIIRERPEQVFSVSSLALLPNPDFVDATVISFNRKEKTQLVRRYRIDIETNETVELPNEFGDRTNNNANITWIDNNRYIISRETGSLSEVGTWIYDLRSKEYKKLTSFYHSGSITADNYSISPDAKGKDLFPTYYYNNYLVAPDKNRVVFETKKGAVYKLLSVSLADGSVVEIPVSKEHKWGKMRRVVPYSIELPMK